MNTRRNDLITQMSEHGDYLKRTAYLVLRDHQLAEDMTQETFISYYKQNAFKRKSSTRTYLYSILMNHIKMHCRKHKTLLIENDVNEISDYNTIIFDQQLIEELDLKNALAKLKDTYKLVIVLYYFDDFTIAEIAQILNCGQSSVKMRLKRGREQLRKLIEKEIKTMMNAREIYKEVDFNGADNVLDVVDADANKIKTNRDHIKAFLNKELEINVSSILVAMVIFSIVILDSHAIVTDKMTPYSITVINERGQHEIY